MSAEPDLIAKAVELAARAHAGQKDKSGNPYLLHPLRVMLQMHSLEERLVAILHDVVEDSDLTPADLLSAGFPVAVVEAIECISRKADESYEQFIDRVSRNRLAAKVKVEDLRDNLDLTRLPVLSENDFTRVTKYHRALVSLRDADTSDSQNRA